MTAGVWSEEDDTLEGTGTGILDETTAATMTLELLTGRHGPDRLGGPRGSQRRPRRSVARVALRPVAVVGPDRLCTRGTRD